MATAYDTVIVGAGNAGVSLAARLRRDGVRDIALIDPSPVHRYRPMLNYAAAGRARMGNYERSMASVVPDGVELLPHAAVRVDPGEQTVSLDAGGRATYRDLVLCPGLTPEWEAVAGLRDAFVDGMAVSAHVPEYVHRARSALTGVRGGTVVFSIPPEPASCGGTVLKAMLLACDHWRREGVLDRLHLHLITPFSGVLGLEEFDARLRPHLDTYGVTVHERTRVEAVDHHARTVTTDGPVRQEFDGVELAYVTPTPGRHGSWPIPGWAPPTTPHSSRWTRERYAMRAPATSGVWGTPQPWAPGPPAARCVPRCRWSPTTSAPPGLVER